MVNAIIKLQPHCGHCGVALPPLQHSPDPPDVGLKTVTCLVCLTENIARFWERQR